MQKRIDLIRKTLTQDYMGMYREAGGELKYPFLTPGSESYADVLWDWDSYFSDVALRQILQDAGDEEEKAQAVPYERGCILNMLEKQSEGWVPIAISREPIDVFARPQVKYSTNMHKPVLAQHAAFLAKMSGDAEWLRPRFLDLQMFINGYRNHQRDAATGLYYWIDDFAIGVDNDPCTFYRPNCSSGSIYLNCLMYRELLAMGELCDMLGLDEVSAFHKKDAEALKAAIREHCWDDRDGFFYSVDLNLRPVEKDNWLHAGQPRDWNCLIQRIGVWSGFMGLWSGVATEEMAQRVVEEHYRNEKTFCAPYGVRTLSKMEKMYNLRGSSNPSSWLGPVWGISNYLTFRGMVKYGFEKDAKDLCEKTVRLFGEDLERNGVLHEYYQPENGMGILNPGFQNWNYLVLNMIAWLEGREVVWEY